MLILTRRTGETVMIGHDVTVTVLGVNGNQVRIGINAPKSVPVHREEIYNKIEKQAHRQRDAKGDLDGNARPLPAKPRTRLDEVFGDEEPNGNVVPAEASA